MRLLGSRSPKGLSIPRLYLRRSQRPASTGAVDRPSSGDAGSDDVEFTAVLAAWESLEVAKTELKKKSGTYLPPRTPQEQAVDFALKRAHSRSGTFAKSSYLSEIRLELFSHRSDLEQGPFQSSIFDPLAARLADELSSMSVSLLPTSLACVRAAIVFHRRSLLNFDRKERVFHPAEVVRDELQGTMVVLLDAGDFLSAVGEDGGQLQGLVEDTRRVAGLEAFEKQLRVVVMLLGVRNVQGERRTALSSRMAEASLVTKCFLNEVEDVQGALDPLWTVCGDVAYMPYQLRQRSLLTFSPSKTTASRRKDPDPTDTFRRMLEEVRLVTPQVSESLVGRFPTLRSLIGAYESSEDGESLLQDLEVEKTASGRLRCNSKLGPAVSRRIYQALMEQDEEHLED